jgi:hypothetical protein
VGVARSWGASLKAEAVTEAHEMSSWVNMPVARII